VPPIEKPHSCKPAQAAIRVEGFSRIASPLLPNRATISRRHNAPNLYVTASFNVALADIERSEWGHAWA